MRGFTRNAINHRFAAELFHHGLGHHVAGAPPDIHNLVVPLAIGDQTGGVLGIDLLDFLFGSTDQFILLQRHQHVIHGNRYPGASRVGESGIHQLVRHDHGIAQAALAEAGVDQTRDLLLLERLVDQREGQTRRQYFGQQGAAHRRFIAHQFFNRLTGFILVNFLEAHDHLGLQLDFAGLVCTRHFGDIGEHRAFAQGADLFAGHVIEAKHDILGRHNDRLAIGGRQHVVGSQHQRARIPSALPATSGT